MRRRVVVRPGLIRRALVWVVRHPYWVVGLIFVARLIEERGP